MTDSVQEHEGLNGPAQVLARIAQVLEENPENGLDAIREAFEAERERAKQEIREKAKDFDSLKEVRLSFFGEKGIMSIANRQMRDLQNQHKGPVGKLMGQARAALNEAIEARTAELEAEREARILAEEAVDVSAASPRRSLGGRHPIALMQERLTDIFVGMGWEVADGPELESEWYNFDALNIKPDHPAREMQDTFYVEPKNAHLLLRTHTSPVQMRSLLSRDLPLYIVCPGQVYRTDELDATHTPVFHQIEGLAVDKGLTMADLKGTLEYMARAMFGEDAKIRLRPNFFPFTEPSAELDLWHPNAKGGPQWIEWGGCGMVNPNVLRAAGIDPEEYSGFAFGMGIERTLMFRNNVADMHDMVEGDIRFSEQFGMEI